MVSAPGTNPEVLSSSFLFFPLPRENLVIKGSKAKGSSSSSSSSSFCQPPISATFFRTSTLLAIARAGPPVFVLQSRWGARWCIPVVAEIEWKCCLCVKRADKRGKEKSTSNRFQLKNDAQQHRTAQSTPRERDFCCAVTFFSPLSTRRITPSASSLFPGSDPHCSPFAFDLVGCHQNGEAGSDGRTRKKHLIMFGGGTQPRLEKNRRESPGRGFSK